MEDIMKKNTIFAAVITYLGWIFLCSSVLTLVYYLVFHGNHNDNFLIIKFLSSVLLVSLSYASLCKKEHSVWVRFSLAFGCILFSCGIILL